MNLGGDVREHAVGWRDGVYLGGGGLVGSGFGGEFQLVDAGRGVDLQGFEDAALGSGELGSLLKGAGGAR